MSNDVISQPEASTSTTAGDAPTIGPLPAILAKARRSKQPTKADLSRDGIKVRDFAYESKLPPVRTIYRHAQQTQPSIPGQRPVKRQLTEPNDENSLGSQPSRLGSQPPQRQDTEPFLEFDSTTQSQQSSYLEPSSQNHAGLAPSSLADISTDLDKYHESLPEFQYSAEYVPTPPVTPNGSLKWKENTQLPVMPQDHEMNVTEVLPHLRSRPPVSPQNRSTRAESSQWSQLSQLSPLTPLPSSPAIPQVRKTISTNSLQPAKKRARLESKEVLSPVSPRMVVSRYPFRRRVMPQAPPHETKPAARRKKAAEPPKSTRILRSRSRSAIAQEKKR